MKRNTKTIILDILTYIFLATVVAFVLMPLLWIISTSLKPAIEIFQKPPHWIPHNLTVSNYAGVITASEIPRAFLNSFLVGALATFLALALGGSAGYAFARFKFRGNKFLSLFMLISQMLPLTVLMIPMYYMENKMSLVDTRFGLALAHLVICMPLVTWMSRGYFKGIPKEIEESAMVDGTTQMQIIGRIILPLIKPSIAATGIYAFVSSWNEFALANVLTRSIQSRTVPIALNEFSTFFKVDWGQTMAAAAIITVPIIVVFLLIQKQFVAGLSAGAVKG